MHRILMIENDPDDRYLTAEVLQNEGVEAELDFIEASGWTEYLIGANRQPDIILLTQNSAPFKFTDLIRQIRQTDGFTTIPLIVLSETAWPEDIRESYALGANSFIKKPDDYSLTLFKIKSFVNYWLKTVEL